MSMSVSVLIVMLTNQEREYGSEKHKDQGLNHSHQKFHEVERNWYQPTEVRHQSGHGFEHIFTSEDVAEQPETQRNGAEQNGNYFKDADQHENDDH